jgi:hypothetical protein
MASKYEMLIGQTVKGVLVSNYVREQRTSKSGRNYSVGRLTVAYQDSKDITLNISISSWNKWSFIRNLDKLNEVNSSSKKQQKTTTGKTKKQTTTKTKTKQQTKTTSSKKQTKQQTIIDVMCDAAHVAKQIAIKYIQDDIELYVDLDDVDDILYFCNMDDDGNKIYQTPEQMFQRFLDTHLQYIELMAKEQYNKMGYTGDSMLDLFTEVFIEVNIKEYEPMLKDFIYSNWHVFEQKYQKAWERKYMSSTKGKVQNEFVVEFKGCTTVKEVKSVYRRLAKQYHSDLGGSDEKFKLVHEAYEAAMKKVA